MTVLRLGTTKKYSDNWDNIFGSSRRSSTKKKAAIVKPARQSAKKKPAKKKARPKTAEKLAKR